MRPIDADELLKQLRRNPLFEKTERDKGMFYVERSCIDAMPTLTLDDVIPHGRWVHDYSHIFACSNCLEKEHMSPHNLRNYCPNCGAKMDLEG